MATIQAYYFTKNNSSNFDCRALPGDAIRCEATVSFSGAEIGKRYNVNWLVQPPTGSAYYLISDTVTATATTSFYSRTTIPGLVAGTYRLTNLIINQQP